MKDLAIKAVVTSPDGFYYREEHEWRGIDAQAADWFNKAFVKIDHIIDTTKRGGDLQAVLSMAKDGVQEPDKIVTGFSRGDLNHIQKEWQKLGDELVAYGDHHAKEHAKKHGEKP